MPSEVAGLKLVNEIDNTRVARGLSDLLRMATKAADQIADELAFNAKVDSKEAQTGLDGLKKKSDDVGKEVEKRKLFRIDFTQAKKGLADVKDGIGGVMSSIVSLRGLVVGGLGFGLLGKKLSDVTKFAARVDVLSEVVRTVGANAGYSAEQVDRVVENIKKMGITTSSAVQTTILGIKSNLPVDQLPELARAAQNIAVVAGIDSSEALRRLMIDISQVDTRGLRMMGIIVDRKEAMENYAKSIGVATNELSKASAREAIFQEILRQDQMLSGAYERAMSKAGKKLTSMPRLMEELRRKIGNQLTPTMALLIDKFMEWLKVLQDDETLSRSVAKLNEFLSKSFDGLNNALKSMYAHRGLIADVFKLFIGGILLAKVFEITKAVQGLAMALKGLAVANPILTAIAIAIGGGTAAWLAYQEATDPAREARRSKELIEANERHIKSLVKKKKIFKAMAKEYEELARQANRSKAQEDRLFSLANSLNSLAPGMITNFDDIAGNAKTLADKLESVNDELDDLNKKSNEMLRQKTLLKYESQVIDFGKSIQAGSFLGKAPYLPKGSKNRGPGAPGTTKKFHMPGRLVPKRLAGAANYLAYELDDLDAIDITSEDQLKKLRGYEAEVSQLLSTVTDINSENEYWVELAYKVQVQLQRMIGMSEKYHDTFLKSPMAPLADESDGLVKKVEDNNDRLTKSFSKAGKKIKKAFGEQFWGTLSNIAYDSFFLKQYANASELEGVERQLALARIEIQRTAFNQLMELAQDELKLWIANEWKKVAVKKVAETAQTTAAVTGSTARAGASAVEDAASAKSIAMKIVESSSKIMASLSGIPFIGPFMGVAAIGAFMALMASIVSKSKGLSKGFFGGGYTGTGGTRDVAGVVHGGEYVFDAKDTERYRSLFEAIRAGALEGIDRGLRIPTPATGLRTPDLIDSGRLKTAPPASPNRINVSQDFQIRGRDLYAVIQAEELDSDRRVIGG